MRRYLGRRWPVYLPKTWQAIHRGQKSLEYIYLTSDRFLSTFAVVRARIRWWLSQMGNAPYHIVATSVGNRPVRHRGNSVVLGWTRLCWNAPKARRCGLIIDP